MVVVMRFDSIGQKVLERGRKRQGEARRKSDVLVCVDVQQGAPIDGMPLAELAEFVRSYPRVIWLMDKIQCEDARMPDVIMDVWGGELPKNVHVIEKEYGGMLHFACEAGLGEEAIAFFRDMARGKAREKIETRHHVFLEAMGSEMRDNFERTWHRMEAASEELITGIGSELVRSLGSEVDLCGGAVGECLQEVEMMFEVHGISVHVVTKFVY